MIARDQEMILGLARRLDRDVEIARKFPLRCRAGSLRDCRPDAAGTAGELRTQPCVPELGEPLCALEVHEAEHVRTLPRPDLAKILHGARITFYRRRAVTAAALAQSHRCRPMQAPSESEDYFSGLVSPYCSRYPSARPVPSLSASAL